MERLKTEVLVVGGGTGGTAAALQAARRGAQTILVSEFSWLGGMLTSAGVSAPDGNELQALQTGIWGTFVQELERRQPGGLDNGWVSFFTYEPRLGAAIFANWVVALPNLHWIQGQVPLDVQRTGDRLSAVRFEDYFIEADIILDGTELGDLLALAEIPYRWGWELQSELGEPSAPPVLEDWMVRYPVQAPTWVVVLRDFGSHGAPDILPGLPGDVMDDFQGAWDGYGAETFLNYGRLPGDRFMINWPQKGNDYGEGCDRLVTSASARQEFFQDAQQYSQQFARFIQQNLGDRYGLASDTFPQIPGTPGGGAFALHPYFRESRRLVGLTTVREQDILPISGGNVAPLPLTPEGIVEAIAVGNYPNDHHYPNHAIPFHPKSMRWGGRWTGTPFAIPYRSLVPLTLNGLLVCDKNISVSHMANGATRLQPLVLGIGQAAGMAAALCIEQQCQPRDLPVSLLQRALLAEPTAPAAVIPLLHPTLGHEEWRSQQELFLNYPEKYPTNGIAACSIESATAPPEAWKMTGHFSRHSEESYRLRGNLLGKNTEPPALVTLFPDVEQQLRQLQDEQLITVYGKANLYGNWIRVEYLNKLNVTS
ncbi:MULTISPECIES: FAD-dependent oxidoreductase [unclassified Leptolyngbya]|uniref:FAD-dependent oxidoreductase n=1 Tax=unclassified Leptolyngbya TaxID=2650499 RepID=UPI0016883F10|nr:MULTISPECIES: FAD-dependent oxidoreductase [unclassified Leptolyngbya]MBD1911051.1 FAD-dependent oxidoreductase [Leptolyngbya sp. FACHB-8]MBD2158283.1 FAD-dependent oxidoreductase [Leptolyngbya sp. FACHB-16]